MNKGLLVALWLFGNLVVVGLYDFYAYYFLSPEESVSYWCQKWMQNWPMLAISVGILIGHLGWPLKRNGVP